jgi:hypothetical protein
MKITESQLRKIVREEASRLVETSPYARSASPSGGFSYAVKLRMLEDAHAALLDVAEYDAREGDIGEDPELDALIRDLEGYMEAVEALAADEDVPAEYSLPKPTPRSMRH